MPKELRKLGFDKEELRAAAYDYCLRTNIHVPQAAISDIEIGEDPAAAVTLKFDTLDVNDVKEVRLNRDQMGAALIRYCGEQKIPIPRRGQKILKIEGEEIALMINIHWAPAGEKKE
ncbi:MAG: hypothetical protein V3R66_07960 [Rhodospirillales bacterium]